MEQKSKYAILIRSHFYNKSIEKIYKYLKYNSEFDVYLAMDESNGFVDTYKNGKIAVSSQIARQMDLYCPSNRALWQCGDYCLYIARHQLPSYAGFFLIDHDVRFRFDDLQSFFGLISQYKSDVMACDFRIAGKDWPWTDCIGHYFRDQYRMFFPFLFIRSNAISSLYQMRVQISSETYQNSLVKYPNDEAFVASCSVSLGLSVIDVNQIFPGAYQPSTFMFNGVFHEDEILGVQNNIGLIHPVLSGDAYIQKLARLTKLVGAEYIIKKLSFIKDDHSLLLKYISHSEDLVSRTENKS